MLVEAAAAVAVALGRPESAARLFAVVDTLRAAVGAAPVFAYVPERSRHDQARLAAREALGEESFAALWAGGAALSLDEAIAEVRVLAAQVAATPSAGVARSARDRRPRAPLSPREREVLALRADGVGDNAIPVALGI